MTTDTKETLRRNAAGWLRTIDDPSQAHEVRLIACSAIGWVLYFVQDDESLLADILRIIRRAIERDDGSPMLLLFEAGPTIHRNATLAAAVMRLGEHAFSRGNVYALARITIALGRRTDSLLRRGESPDPLRAPSHWIRALIESARVDELGGDMRDAVRWWLEDEGNDLNAVRDVIPEPETWGNSESQARKGGDPAVPLTCGRPDAVCTTNE